MSKFEDLLESTFRWHGLPIQFHRLDDHAMANVVNQFKNLNLAQTLKWLSKNEQKRILIGDVILKGEHIYALFNFCKGWQPKHNKDEAPLSRFSFYIVMFSYGKTVCWAKSPTGKVLLNSIKKHIKPSICILLH